MSVNQNRARWNRKLSLTGFDWLSSINSTGTSTSVGEAGLGDTIRTCPVKIILRMLRISHQTPLHSGIIPYHEAICNCRTSGVNKIQTVHWTRNSTYRTRMAFHWQQCLHDGFYIRRSEHFHRFVYRDCLSWTGFWGLQWFQNQFFIHWWRGQRQRQRKFVRNLCDKTIFWKAQK